MSLAQSQSASPPQPQQDPQSTQQLKPQTTPRRIPVVSVSDAARNAKAKVDESAPQNVYTNDSVAALPPGGISIVGPPAPPPGVAKPKPKPTDNTAKLAAYWKARFTAARQKLAQDTKALSALQTQLDIHRVQEYTVDECAGQVYSDIYMDLLHQIDAMKVTIQNDKQALSDLHDEFRHAGGLPGWIRQRQRSFFAAAIILRNFPPGISSQRQLPIYPFIKDSANWLERRYSFKNCPIAVAPRLG